MVRLWNNLSEFYNLHQILFSVTFIKSPYLTWNRFKIFSWLLTAFHDILFLSTRILIPTVAGGHLHIFSALSLKYVLHPVWNLFSWTTPHDFYWQRFVGFSQLSSLSWQPFLLFFWERFIVFLDSWTIFIFSWQDHWNMLFFLFEDGFLPRQSIAFIDKESGFVIGFSSWWWQPFLLFFCPRISLFPPLVVAIFTFPPLFSILFEYGFQAR